MNIRTAVASVLALAVCYGIVDTYYYSAGMTTPRVFDVPLMLALAVIGYLWYRQDSQAVAYRGSTAVAGLVILLPAIGVPIYLASSRQRGKKLAAVGRFLLLILGFIVLSSLGVGLVELQSAA